MSRAGDVLENKVTGERGVVVVGTEETDGDYLKVDLYIAPGGAVAGEHVHPILEEKFTVIRGQVGFRINGVEKIAPLNETLTVRPGTIHDWWNAGDEEALVTVEISPAARFEAMASNLFGLANDDKTNAKGMPNPLQLAVFGKEYQDVVVFTNPPILVQKIMFALLAPIGRLFGYKSSYDKYMQGVYQPTSFKKPKAFKGHVTI